MPSNVGRVPASSFTMMPGSSRGSHGSGPISSLTKCRRSRTRCSAVRVILAGHNSARQTGGARCAGPPHRRRKIGAASGAWNICGTTGNLNGKRAKLGRLHLTGSRQTACFRCRHRGFPNSSEFFGRFLRTSEVSPSHKPIVSQTRRGADGDGLYARLRRSSCYWRQGADAGWHHPETARSPTR